MFKLSKRNRNTLFSVGVCVALLAAYYQWQSSHAPLDHTRMTLIRGACLLNCPVYRIDIYGDGTVVYHGDNHVDVTGQLQYRIPAEAAKELLDRYQKAGFWALKDAYVAGITDQPTDFIGLQIGPRSKIIKDYAGQVAGMPAAVGDLENAVDQAAHTRSLITRDAETPALMAAAQRSGVGNH